MKIAVNKCFGGFSLSEEALQYLEAVHGVKIYESWDELQNGRVDGELWSLRDSKFSRQIAYSNASRFRTDSRVIEVIEKLGSKANGDCANIKIIIIPDDIEYEIDNYDGMESIHEKHRPW